MDPFSSIWCLDYCVRIDPSKLTSVLNIIEKSLIKINKKMRVLGNMGYGFG